MGQYRNSRQLRLSSALIAAASLAGCNEGSTRYQYSEEEAGRDMPAPKLADREKCYGISLAQHNDCATAKGASCAGTADTDYMPDRWKYVEPGTCEGLGGKPEAPDPMNPPSGK